MYAFIKRVAVTTWPVAVEAEVEFSTLEVADDTYNMVVSRQSILGVMNFENNDRRRLTTALEDAYEAEADAVELSCAKRTISALSAKERRERAHRCSKSRCNESEENKERLGEVHGANWFETQAETVSENEETTGQVGLRGDELTT